MSAPMSPSKIHASPVDLEDLVNMTLSEDGSLRKAGKSHSWNASASSLYGIENIGVGVTGFVFQPVIGATFICGLTGMQVVRDDYFKNLEFAVACYEFGTMEVWEQGSYICSRALGKSEEVRIRISCNTDGMMEYCLNEDVICVSGRAPAHPLFVQVGAHSPGGILSNLCWLGSSPKKIAKGLYSPAPSRQVSPWSQGSYARQNSGSNSLSPSLREKTAGSKNSRDLLIRSISETELFEDPDISPATTEKLARESSEASNVADETENKESERQRSQSQEEKVGKSVDRLNAGTTFTFAFIFLVLSGAALVAGLRSQDETLCIVPMHAVHDCSQTGVHKFSGVVYHGGSGQSESCSTFEHEFLNSESECIGILGSEVSCTREPDGKCRYGSEKSENGSAWLTLGIVCGVCSFLSCIFTLIVHLRNRRARSAEMRQ